MILLQLLITAGLMYPIAVASVFFRDVQHALPILITTLFYVTPVFYPASMIPDQVRGLFLLNPLAWLMIVYQSILYDGQLPEPGCWLGLAAAAAVLFSLGYLIFKRYQHVCIEIA